MDGIKCFTAVLFFQNYIKNWSFLCVGSLDSSFAKLKIVLASRHLKLFEVLKPACHAVTSATGHGGGQEGRCWPPTLGHSCLNRLRHCSQAWIQKASSSMLILCQRGKLNNGRGGRWREMRHAGSGVLIACLSRDEPPTFGLARSSTGHEGSLDPDGEHPH